MPIIANLPCGAGVHHSIRDSGGATSEASAEIVRCAMKRPDNDDPFEDDDDGFIFDDDEELEEDDFEDDDDDEDEYDDDDELDVEIETEES